MTYLIHLPANGLHILWPVLPPTIQRTAQAYQLGMLDLTRDPADPLRESDCTFLGFLCSASRAMSNTAWLFVGTSTGGRAAAPHRA